MNFLLGGELSHEVISIRLNEIETPRKEINAKLEQAEELPVPFHPLMDKSMIKEPNV